MYENGEGKMFTHIYLSQKRKVPHLQRIVYLLFSDLPTEDSLSETPCIMILRKMCRDLSL